MRSFVCIYLKFVEILFGHIPGVIIMYITSILEKMVEEVWLNTFVPCMYKFETMQAIYVSYRGAVASWLVRSTLEWVIWVQALAGDIVLCSWATHFTLTVLLSTQVYKWVPAICWGNLTKLWKSDLQWTSIPSRGSRNTSSRFMLQKPG